MLMLVRMIIKTNSKFATVVICAVVSWLCVGCRKPIDKDEILSQISEAQQRALDPMMNTPSVVDGIRELKIVSAADADLAERVEVVGVVVKDQTRAYPLSLFSGMTSRVVNDYVDVSDTEGIPVSVSYCDISNRVRVLTAVDLDEHDDALDIGMLGLIDGSLALRWQEHAFKQAEEVAGLVDLDFQRTTWGEWKETYPSTRVYIGRKKTEGSGN